MENTVGKGEIARNSVFKRLVLQTRKKQGLFGKGLRHNVSTNQKSLFYNCTKIGCSSSAKFYNSICWYCMRATSLNVRFKRTIDIPEMTQFQETDFLLSQRRGKHCRERSNTLQKAVFFNLLNIFQKGCICSLLLETG